MAQPAGLLSPLAIEITGYPATVAGHVHRLRRLHPWLWSDWQVGNPVIRPMNAPHAGPAIVRNDPRQRSRALSVMEEIGNGLRRVSV
jgi:hypothetical protein